MLLPISSKDICSISSRVFPNSFCFFSFRGALRRSPRKESQSDFAVSLSASDPLATQPSILEWMASHSVQKLREQKRCIASLPHKVGSLPSLMHFRDAFRCLSCFPNIRHTSNHRKKHGLDRIATSNYHSHHRPGIRFSYDASRCTWYILVVANPHNHHDNQNRIDIQPPDRITPAEYIPLKP